VLSNFRSINGITSPAINRYPAVSTNRGVRRLLKG
jgi:hypothetical protein